ncbi:uncharacterized protein LOC104581706 isoform X2 [Brachypodium distachyon]|uniref:Uncharacterized protein n=1 Tax=Brachypodium distachyon TaxID=15368 RepID=A0A0Q3LC76_BRADI|nr:uncharacterized protein LOC104581706 isoform X2 [Brachypodium distachyon]KQK20697.1 hypothetical protein BRADI_1g56095v3 [Brachypodium distachyon]|eukprot:XP_010228313.1 uncharacterized protein LOC104581706 isoform X2 [Brachypodium distachyon]
MEAQYDLWWGLLEEGRAPPAPAPPVTAEPIAADIAPRAARPRSMAKPDNPDWVRATRTCGNVVGIVCLVYIFLILVPRCRNRDYMLLYCVFAVVLSLGFPTLAYVLTLDVDCVDRPLIKAISPMSSIMFS